MIHMGCTKLNKISLHMTKPVKPGAVDRPVVSDAARDASGTEIDSHVRHILLFPEDLVMNIFLWPFFLFTGSRIAVVN